jgi:preprotein translocase subunit SecE
MQEKAERKKRAGSSERPTPAANAAARRAQAAEKKKKRTGPRQFLKEVRTELRRVDWPSRAELISYTMVVLVTIVVLTTYVFGLDSLFSKAILKLLGS